MVSTWRFWSGKEIDLSRSHPFRLILVMAIVLYVDDRFSQVVSVCDRADLHVLGHLGAGGVWMVAAAAAWAEGRTCQDMPESPNAGSGPASLISSNDEKEACVQDCDCWSLDAAGRELKDALSESSLAASIRAAR